VAGGSSGCPLSLVSGDTLRALTRQISLPTRIVDLMPPTERILMSVRVTDGSVACVRAFGLIVNARDVCVCTTRRER